MRARRHPTLLTVLVIAAVLMLAWGGGKLAGRASDTQAAASAPVAAAAPDPGPVAAPALTAGEASGAAAASAAVVGDATQAVDTLDADTPGSEIGVAVEDRTTGQTSVGDDGAKPFYAASVVKLYTVVDILHSVETGEVTLTDTDRTNIQRALSYSDDDAEDALWEKFGGAAGVSRTIALAGLQDSSPPTDPSQWGETLISARDVVSLYDYVLTSMTPASRDMIMDALQNAQDTGADGFDQAFGLITPPRPAGVAAKQGWMWIGDDFYLHSTGVLGPDQRYVVAVLSENEASAGAAAASTLVSTATAGVEKALAG
ncbi:MAG: hypothetical protein QOF00_5055 [Pseudonocardiales bacterium]|nr:hypothetical protein [Pseudonocardiales bacterium]